MPRVWSSLLKVKIAEEGIPSSRISVASKQIETIERKLTSINLEINLVLTRGKDEGLISIIQTQLTSLFKNRNSAPKQKTNFKQTQNIQCPPRLTVVVDIQVDTRLASMRIAMVIDVTRKRHFAGQDEDGALFFTSI